MNWKISFATALLVATLPVSVRGQEANKYQGFQVSCNDRVKCDGVNRQQQDITQTRKIQPPIPNRDSKFYGGGTLGVFFPSEIENTDIDPSTGFGGSIYGGYKFNNFISVDTEFLIFSGDSDVETVDGSFTSWSIFLNPRFTYAFNQNSERSPYIFASPGVGFGRGSLGGDVADTIEEVNDGDTSGDGLAIQAKAGIGFPISDRVDLIGQARYTNIFGVSEDVPELENGIPTGETEDRDISTFGVEFGLNFKF